MSGSATRLTLYAVVSAIEMDLRGHISQHLGDLEGEQLFGAEVWGRALDRMRKDDPGADAQPRVVDVLCYVDLGDLYQALNRQRGVLPDALGQQIRDLTPPFQMLVGVRNRVMHLRPLQFRDLPTVIDLAQTLERSGQFGWRNVCLTLERLKSDPGYVLSLQIPVWDAGERITHNLPIPEFDETGFIGRSELVSQLVTHCLGPYPVITIVGEGGVGKTALALKVAYDILDMPRCPFDAVIWSSSRTRQLTAGQIEEIRGSIRDSLGLIRAISDELGGTGAEDPLAEVLEFLSEFRILVILDNLETVLDDRIAYFMRKLPGGSKVLITSRIGLGAFEFPVKLGPLTDQEAVQLLRVVAQLRGVRGLSRTNQLSRYCRRMRNNPGFIKWFVSAVQAGQRPEAVLAQPDTFLDFCMSNVYNYLSETARTVLKALQAFPGRHSLAEVAFLVPSLDTVELQRALQDLLRTNMVQMTSIPRSSTFESKYYVSELAKDYLDAHHPLEQDELRELVTRRRQLTSAAEQMDAERRTNPYSFRAIRLRSKSDRIVAKLLLDALKSLARSDVDGADKLVEEALRLSPEYFEVHRILASVRVVQGNFVAARAAYEAAIELEPDSAPLRYWYAGFVLRSLDDTEGALEQLQEAAKLDPDAHRIQLETARVYLYQHRFRDGRDILDSLLQRGDLSLHDSTKVWDLHLQYYARLADHLCSQRDSAEALDVLRSLRSQYNACPEHLRDDAMRRRLRKALPTAWHCLNYSVTERDHADATAIIEWLQREGTVADRAAGAEVATWRDDGGAGREGGGEGDGHT